MVLEIVQTNVIFGVNTILQRLPVEGEVLLTIIKGNHIYKLWIRKDQLILCWLLTTIV